MRRKLFIASVALCVLALTVCFFSACSSDYPDTDNSEYSVTFIADGKVIAVETYRDGDKVTEPEVPEKSGYTGSWQQYETDGDKIVSAVYVPIEYKATFVADGVTVGALTFTVEDDGLDEPEVPSKEGYVAQWEEYSLEARDITVNAVYIAAEYTVTFIADGKVVAKVPYSTGDEAVSVPDVPGKANYIGKWEEFSLDGDVTVEAVYESALSFTFTADCNSYAVRACAADVTEVEIPDRYEGLPVTAVADNAFKGCAYLEKVVLPDTLVSIGNAAFSGCSSLKDLNIPVNIKTLGARAFYQCTSLEDIFLCDVFYLGDEAFAGCISLENVTFGEDLKTVGNYAFSGCIKLSGAVLPDGVTEIGEGAFSGCAALESLKLPVSLSVISDKAFKDCGSLLSVTVPAGVAKIGAYAFSGCLSMSELTIFGGVSEWGEYAFCNCLCLSKIYFGSSVGCEIAENARVFYGAGSDRDGITVTVGENGMLPENMFKVYEGAKTPDVTKVIFGQGTAVLSDDSNEFPFLDEVVIPESVVAISAGALSGYMSAAENVGGVAYLDGWAVACNEPSGELSLPDGTRGIADRAFYACDGLTSICIPGSVMHIGSEAFSVCKNLAGVIVSGENTSVGAGAFSGCEALSYVSWNVVRAVDPVKDDAIFYNSGTNGEGVIAEFGADVTRIPSGIFYKNVCLTEVVAYDGVTEIGEKAFYGCENLNSVTVGENVSLVEREAFSGCNIVSAVIPVELIDDIEVSTLKELTVVGEGEIGSEAFEGCESLVKVTIDKITSVGEHAFGNCHMLRTISARELTEVGEGAFSGCLSVICVTAQPSVFEHFPVKSFEEITICGSGKITEGQFAGNIYLKSVVISRDITEIGEGAFKDCSALGRVVFENSEGWIASETNGMTEEIKPEDLSDETYAARLLTGDRCCAKLIRS